MSTTTVPAPDTPKASATCGACAGSGWADPWELADGTPELVSCDRCLGVGLEGCPDCDGEGVIAPPRPCPCQDVAAA